MRCSARFPAIADLAESALSVLRHLSFVVCNLNDVVETIFDKLELLEMMNVTPTESEAWDIVQMEEIERELLDSDDVEFGVEQS